MRTPSTIHRLGATLGAATLLAALTAAPTALASDDCQRLVTHTPSSSSGDTSAVAITSQALAADTPGWERVGWQAAAGTTVTKVTVVREDGAERRTDGDLSTGHAEHVIELRFCGSSSSADDAEGTSDHDAEVQITPEPAPSDDDSADTTTTPSTDDSDAAEAADAPTSAAGPEDTASAAVADPGDAGTSTSDEASTAAPAPDEPTADGAPDDMDATDPAPAGDDADTTRDTDESGDERDAADGDRTRLVQQAGTATGGASDELTSLGSDPTPLLAGGALGLLAGLTALVGAHRRQREDRR